MNGLMSAIGVLEYWRDFYFAQPWYLLLILPLILFSFLYWKKREAIESFKYTRAKELSAFQSPILELSLKAVDALLFVAMLLLISALAKPQILGEPDTEGLEGIDIAVVLDVSGSMNAEDFKPKNRLFVAKQTIEEYLFNRENDRISLVVFAGEAYTQAPLTHDHQLLGQMLDSVSTGVLQDGTAIGDAVATGVNRLRDSTAKSKVMILLTDGDSNAGKIAPKKAAELAKEFGIQLFTILVGRGGLVPFPQSIPGFPGRKKYINVEIPTNPELLKEMAAMTDAQFFEATDSKALKGSFQAILSDLDKSYLENSLITRRRIDLYPLFLLLSLLFMGSSLLLSTSKLSVLSAD